jgi:hypothetical protein
VVACIVDGLDLLRSDGPCFNLQQTLTGYPFRRETQRLEMDPHMISRRLLVFHRTWPGSFCGSAYDCRSGSLVFVSLFAVVHGHTDEHLDRLLSLMSPAISLFYAGHDSWMHSPLSGYP